MQKVLLERQYFSLEKAERGVVRELLRKVSGFSLPQVTRLIRRYREEGAIQARRGVRRGFATKYNLADPELPVEVDRAHGRLSGPARRRILEREWQVFAQPAYARLAEIWVGPLYNLRNSVAYRQRAAEFTATKPAVREGNGTARKKAAAGPGVERGRPPIRALKPPRDPTGGSRCPPGPPR
jgi:hypothetical protein